MPAGAKSAAGGEGTRSLLSSLLGLARGLGSGVSGTGTRGMGEPHGYQQEVRESL